MRSGSSLVTCVPTEYGFARIGALDRHRSSTRFRIGRHHTLRPDSTGEPCCFANDVPGMFWKNQGEMRCG